MDLEGLLFSPPVVQTLVQFLSVEDVFALSALNRRMYYEWATKRCVAATNLRTLVRERFGWTYNKTNPFVMLRKRMPKLRTQLVAARSSVDCTGGCGKRVNGRDLMDAAFCRYATCRWCFFGDNDTKLQYVMRRFDLMRFEDGYEYFHREVKRHCPFVDDTLAVQAPGLKEFDWKSPGGPCYYVRRDVERAISFAVARCIVADFNKRRREEAEPKQKRSKV